MKRFHVMLAAAAMLGLTGPVGSKPALSAPPTVTPSPGYDARLVEQRAAMSAHVPLTPQRKALHRRSAKPIGHGY